MSDVVSAKRRIGNGPNSIDLLDNAIGMTPRTTDPATDANLNQVYGKFVAGKTELCHKNTRGEVTPLTSGGMVNPTPEDLDETFISDFEGAADWTVTAGVAVRTNAQFSEGSYSWQITESATIERAFSPALDLSEHFIALDLRVDNEWNSINPHMYIRFYASATKYFQMDCLGTAASGGNPFPWQNSRWFPYTFVRSFATAIGGAVDADWKNIIKVEIQVISGLAGTHVWLDNMRAVRTWHEGILTICFDDARADQMPAFSYMQKFGLKGNVFVITSTVGGGGVMTYDNLRTLNSVGWDVCSHQNKHVGTTTMTPKEAITDRIWAREYLQRSGFWKGADTFAYPLGTPDPEARKIYRLCRGYTYANIAGPETIPPAIDWIVRDNEPGSLAAGQAMVDNCIRCRNWEIMTFHGPPAWFNTLIDYIVASGVKVLTFSQVYDNFARSFSRTRNKEADGAFQKTMKEAAVAVAIGLSGVYGADTNLYSPAGRLKNPKMQITTAGVAGGETVTVKVTIFWEDQTTTNVTKVYVGPGGGVWNVTEAEWLGVWKDSNTPRYIIGNAKSSAAGTAATVTIDHLMDGA